MKLDGNKVKLAIAPIGWTNDDMPDLGAEITFEQCVSEMALAGFVGCEVGNKYPKDIKVLKHKLDVRGLQVCNAWFSSLLLSEGFDVTIENFKKHIAFLSEMGAKVVGASEQGNSIQGKNLDIFKHKPTYTADEWKAVVYGFNAMGQIAKENGMFFTVHHHMGTGVQTAEEIDKLMEMTDSDLVFLLFDTGHLAFSQEDSLAVLKKYVKRTRHVHLKSIRNNKLAEAKEKGQSFLQAVRNGVFTVPGDGDYDFLPVFEILAKNDYEGWMVVEAEQDPAIANPFEYAKLAREYIKQSAGI